VSESPVKTIRGLVLFIIEGGSENVRLRKHENNSVEFKKRATLYHLIKELLKVRFSWFLSNIVVIVI